jgi:hypothetical protein
MYAHDKDNIESSNLTTELTFATSTRLSRSTAGGSLQAQAVLDHFALTKLPPKDYIRVLQVIINFYAQVSNE